MNEIAKLMVFAITFFLLYLGTKLRITNHLLQSKNVFKSSLIGIFLLQMLVIFATSFQVGDVMLFSDAGYYLNKGIDYYWIDSDHNHYPFFPFLIFFHALANRLSGLIRLVSFVQILKLGLLLVLYQVAFQIYRQSKSTLVERRRLVLEFLTNPITYLVVLFHGQIDVILIMFFIYASNLLLKSKSLKESVLAGLLFAASVASKTWSVIFLPLYLRFMGFRKTLLVGLVTATFLFIDIFIYTRLVFGSGFKVVLPALSKPGGPVGIWGISYLFQEWANVIMTNNLLIFGGLLVLGLSIIYVLKAGFWDAVTMLILWVYLIIPNWGVQYLFWVLPFSYLIRRDRVWVFFDLFAGLYLLLNYMNIIEKNLFPSWIILNSGLGVWILILWTLIRTAKEGILRE